MAADRRTDLGKRIAAVRSARRMRQRDLAEAANVSLSMIRKLEQGSRQPGEDVLSAVAAALSVGEDRLAGGAGRTNARAHLAIPAIRRLVDTYDLPEEGPVRPIKELGSEQRELVGLRLSSQYTRLAQRAVPLISELTRAVHIWPSPERAQAAAMLSAAYRAADAVTYKYGYYDLSGRLVELMRWAANQADDSDITAAAAYVRTEVFFASGNLEPGLRALRQAIDCAPSPAGLSAHAAVGALHMRAAVLAGRLRDPQSADGHLREARLLAAAVPEGIYNGTAFGPASVRVHQMAVAVELGDPAAAIRVAQDWVPPRALPPERRSHYYIDLARAQLWQGDREDAFESLQAARRIAPQHVREHPYVREALATLLRLHRAPTEALISYAEWAQAV